jgi:hypothetical protein
MGDNKPSVTAQQNFTDCTQSKHIDRRAHYIRHLCHAKKLNYKHIPGPRHGKCGRCAYKSTSRYNFQKVQKLHEHSMKLTGLSWQTTQRAPVTRV